MAVPGNNNAIDHAKHDRAKHTGRDRVLVFTHDPKNPSNVDTACSVRALGGLAIYSQGCSGQIEASLPVNSALLSH